MLIGKFVLYTPTDDEKTRMTNLSNCNTTDVVPALVTNEFGGELLNLRVFYDGSVVGVWNTSVQHGKEPGQWFYHDEYEKLVEEVSDLTKEVKAKVKSGTEKLKEELGIENKKVDANITSNGDITDTTIKNPDK